MRRLARFWPRSLATRTAVLLLAALVTVQVAGLSIDALDRLDLARLAQVRDISIRLSALFRAVASAPREDRAEALRTIALPPEMRAQILPRSPLDTAGPLPLAPEPLKRALHVAMLLVPMPPWLRPDKFVVRGDFPAGRLLIGMRLPSQGGWLTVNVRVPPPLPWHSPGFLGAFVLMTVVAALLTVWAVRRLTEPVRTLAAAAERLGRDVNAPPLAEDGPAEVATAAAAFNTMAARIRRFVDDRTFLLTAIGHDPDADHPAQAARRVRRGRRAAAEDTWPISTSSRRWSRRRSISAATPRRPSRWRPSISPFSARPSSTRPATCARGGREARLFRAAPSHRAGADQRAQAGARQPGEQCDQLRRRGAADAGAAAIGAGADRDRG